MESQKFKHWDDKRECSYHIVKIQWPRIFTSFFPLIIVLRHQFVCIKQASIEFLKLTTFKALKPENFVFYLMQIASFDRWITQSCNFLFMFGFCMWKFFSQFIWNYVDVIPTFSFITYFAPLFATFSTKCPHNPISHVFQLRLL